MVITAILLVWLIFSGYSPVLYINVTIVLFIQIIAVISYINKWNRQLYDFFKALAESNYEIPYSLRSGTLWPVAKPLDDLKNHIRNQRQKHRVENEYFKVLSQQVSTGILVVNEKDDVVFFNKALEQLLGMPVVRNLNTIARKFPEVIRMLSEMKPGNDIEVDILLDDAQKKLLVSLTVFTTEKLTSRVFTFDDVRGVISRSEVESWQKLIRVLNHEIMNSVGPINSTTETLLDRWKMEGSKKPDEKLISKTRRGLEIIGERSRGLAAFARAYRSLTKAPEPKLGDTNLNTLVYYCVDLFKEELNKNNISILSYISTDFNVLADPDFLQQILINLIKNAIESFSGFNQNNPEISISIKGKADKPILIIADNGKGMEKETLEKSVVPFFTTKQTGSGIGLSLSRQLMQSMNGSLEIRSIARKGTEVRLRF